MAHLIVEGKILLNLLRSTKKMTHDFVKNRLVTFLAATALAGIGISNSSQTVKAELNQNFGQEAKQEKQAPAAEKKEETAQNVSALKQKSEQDKEKMAAKKEKLACQQELMNKERQRLTALKEKNKASQADLDQEIEQKRQKIEASHQEESDLRQSLLKQEGQLQQMQSDLQALHNQKQAVQDQLESEQGNLAEIDETIKAEKNKLDSLISELASDSTKDNSVDENLAALKNLHEEIKQVKEQIQLLKEQLQEKQVDLTQSANSLKNKQAALTKIQTEKETLGKQLEEERAKEEKLPDEIAYWQKQMDMYAFDPNSRGQFLTAREKMTVLKQEQLKLTQQRKNDQQNLNEKTELATQMQAEIDKLLVLQKQQREAISDLNSRREQREQLYNQLTQENVALSAKLVAVWEESKNQDSKQKTLLQLKQAQEDLHFDLEKQFSLQEKIIALSANLIITLEKDEQAEKQLAALKIEVEQGKSRLLAVKAESERLEHDLNNLRAQRQAKEKLAEEIEKQAEKVNNLAHVSSVLQKELEQLEITLDRDLTALAKEQDKLSALQKEDDLLSNVSKNHRQSDNLTGIIPEKLVQPAKQALDNAHSDSSDENAPLSRIKILVHVKGHWQSINLKELVNLLQGNNLQKLSIKCSFQIKAHRKEITFYHENGQKKGKISNPDGKTKFVFAEAKMINGQLMLRVLNSKYWLKAQDLELGPQSLEK